MKYIQAKVMCISQNCTTPHWIDIRLQDHEGFDHVDEIEHLNRYVLLSEAGFNSIIKRLCDLEDHIGNKE